MSPRNPAPVSPFPLQGDRTTSFPAGSFRAQQGHRVDVVQHKHPDFASRNRYDVSCEVCGVLVTYHAQAYGHDYTTKDACDGAAMVDAREHARTHATVCPGVRARRKPGCTCRCHGTGAGA